MTWPPQPYDEPEERAWGLVIDALAEAIDEEGLQPYDRGVLARMHEEATLHVGASPVRVPESAPGPQGDWTQRGVYTLGLDPSTVGVLRQRGITQIKDLIALGGERLLLLRGIGPVRYREIMVALGESPAVPLGGDR